VRQQFDIEINALLDSLFSQGESVSENVIDIINRLIDRSERKHALRKLLAENIKWQKD
jgi:hypothetical protein